MPADPSAHRPGILAERRHPFTGSLIVHALLFFSGALALVYEILWLRRFTAIFGASTPATAATLAAVLLGFAAGGVVLGRWAAGNRRPLRGYGALEIAAGLGALGVEAWLRLYDHHAPTLYQALANSPTQLTVVRTLLTLVALFPPTFFMGGTLPLLGQALADGRRRLGITTGSLYAVNTAGAALGALSVPFFWLPRLGATASYAACVAASILIGGLAWMLDRGPRTSSPEPDRSKPGKMAGLRRTGSHDASAVHPATLPFRVLLILSALSGGLMFILEVTWSRMFAQVHENSIYSFAVVLAVFLVGLAGGSALARAALRRGGSARGIFGAGWRWGGIAVFASPPIFYALTHGLTYLAASHGWADYGLKVMGLAAPTVLLPTLLAGMALPALMELCGTASGQPAARVLGALLGANTVGSIAGSLAAAFLFPRWLGLWWTIAAVGLVLFAVGEAVAGGWARPWFTPRRGVTVVGMAVAVFLWNPSGLPRVKFEPQQGERIIALNEGSHGIVAVVGAGVHRRIKLDNYYILGGTGSAGDERMQGHLPLLLHPSPRRVAFLGLGTGITAGATMLHPTESVTAVELVPEVVNAAAGHFQAANLGLLQSSRTRVVAEDARQFLRGTPERFDVIVGDLVVPWRRGEAALYFSDHFEAARHALAPGGLFCQWLPLFQLSEGEFNIVAATFLDVFPHATLWRGDFAPDRPALALVGHADDSPLDPAVVEHRIRELRPDGLNPQLVHPAGLWMFLVGPLDPRDPRFASARRNRADQPWLELLGPLAQGGTDAEERVLFTGRRLEPFLAEIRSKTLTGTPLANIGSDPVRWRDAGGGMGAASVMMLENRNAAGDSAMRAAASGLPAQVRTAVLGPGN